MPTLTCRLPAGLATSLALALAAVPARAQLIVPPLVAAGGHQGDPLIRAGYLDVTLYGADSTGARDSTAALQSAINDGRDFSLATYLPPGTYLISDTLVGDEHWGNCVASVATGTFYPWGSPRAPSLVGPASGPRPLLLLAPSSPGFNDSANPKAMIHFFNDGLQADGTPAPEYVTYPIDSKAAAADCFMFSAIRDVDLSVGQGNSGAVGIQFYAAQYSYLQNISVDATGGYAGIEGTSDTEVWVNLSVTGGQYGVRLDEQGGDNAIAGLTLKNQTVAGLYNFGSLGATTITGFDIQEASAPAAMVGDAVWQGYPSGPQTSSVSLIDGYLSVAGGNQPALQNVDGISLYLNDVYVRAPAVLVQNRGVPTLTASGGVDLIAEYGHPDSRSTGAGGRAPLTSVSVVNGVSSQQDTVAVQANVGGYPSDLVLRHLPGPLPWMNDPGTVWVTAMGADPTGYTDSTAAIQKAINASDRVFLPRGDYVISGTLSLNPNTQFFGVPGLRSRIMAPYWTPTDGQIHPLVSTANSATGKTVVSDISIELDVYPSTNSPNVTYAQTFLNAIDWQTGASSIQNQLSISLDWVAGPDVSSAPRKIIHVMNNGGGRWYGTQMQLCCANGNRSNNPEFRTLMVDGTQAQGALAPLTIYGSNPEHASQSFLQLSAASNVRFLGIKSETIALADVSNSDNVMFAGINGDAEPTLGLTHVTNLVIANQGYYSGAVNTANVPDIDFNGTLYSFNDSYSLFKVGDFRGGFNGTFNGVVHRSPFPYCGDGVCDGAETGGNCPADCGGAPVDAGTPDAGAGRPAWNACRLSAPIVVDGSASDWSAVPSFFVPYTRSVVTSSIPTLATSNADNSANVRAAWDATNLYVLVEVTDNAVIDAPGTALYNEDSTELYLDGTHSRAASYGAGDYQLIVTAGNRADPAMESATGFAHATARTATGYTVEYAVPWAALGARDSGVVGFDLAVNDNDDGGSRKSQLMWSGDGTAYLDPRQFGDLTIDPSACGAPAAADAGTAAPDAGEAGDGGARPGTGGAPGKTGPLVGGCGCSANGSPFAGLVLLWVLRRKYLIVDRRTRE